MLPDNPCHIYSRKLTQSHGRAQAAADEQDAAQKCPRCGHGFVLPGDNFQPFIDCPECKFDFCVTCHGKPHPGEKCSPEALTCPECKGYGVRDDSNCNKMTCPYPEYAAVWPTCLVLFIDILELRLSAGALRPTASSHFAQSAATRCLAVARVRRARMACSR